ncbi:PLP-dependent transferase [Leucogyrophana mollusca]|uniref:PLP-dependent transferase n=1 Tax=Leucogyrophana mollusca TaxID=85980 RepID=A0ACB8BHG4_9AGAM|nr:PLP-dependent transferase [Leucogyrophana mollusca]
MASKFEFGHNMLQHFALSSEYTNLNHGSFGSVPKPVLEASEKISAQIESNPDAFFRLEYQPLLNAARASVAKLIHAGVDECVLVSNVALGINTVLRNLQWGENDTLITTNVTFDSIARAARHITSTPPYPKSSEFNLSFPSSRSVILTRFREHLRSVKESSPQSPTRKIVAVIDSVLSTPAVLMPWREMVEVCREEGVLSVIDAAHSIGQETDINLMKVSPDFWVSSCCKWLYSKRGCAVLYVPKRNQHLITTSLPTAINYMSPSPDDVFSDFETRFFWCGSNDMTAPLSLTSAVKFRELLGGEERINAYCRQLALDGGKRLAHVLGTHVLESDEHEGEFNTNMVNVELPLSGAIKSTADTARMFQQKLLVEHKVYAAHFYHNGKWYVRASAQIYNEIGDFEKLGVALLEVCKQVGTAHNC